MKTSPEQVAEALRGALKESERLRQQNRRLIDAAAEPIAIVGMGCRYPGGANSPEQLWELLVSARDAISPFPTDRGWDLERIYDPDPDQPGTTYVREGGFLYDAGEFDPGFFGISPREALVMDPQERLLLETSWEALEDAAIDPHSLRGLDAGVFAGVMYHDYGWDRRVSSPELGDFLPTGGSASPVSGRVAYALGLEGPAMTIDTACSSSLVAMHLAARALRAGDCSLALAGGVTTLSTPVIFTQFSRQRGVARDARCKPFSDVADGAGFSEGVGVLVLERLADAQRNGHPVLATIRGSAINQDGASNGMTAPNGPAQERVIRSALASAALQAADVDVVEAHGTGTALGDPIEAGALLATYGQGRERPLLLGSLKSNIGHTQAAAGVAGVIKLVLALREGRLPSTLHAEQPSTKIDWRAGTIELLTESRPWETNGAPRRGAVSSFGATGTNAHMVLEEAPASPADGLRSGVDDAPPALVDWAAQPRPETPLCISAKSEPALGEAAARLATRLREAELDPLDVGFSLATGRATFEHRAVLLSRGRQHAASDLEALAAGELPPSAVQGRAAAGGKVAFLFPGQGSQWPGMGAELARVSPLFAERLAACDEALAPHTGWSVSDVLNGVEGSPSIERIEVVQPVLFAVCVALAELWQACGARPAAVAGHSQGEIAAAHVAGGLSLDDASLLAAVRSRIIAKLAGSGAMVSVALPVAQAETRIAEWRGRIEVAACNGPSSTILSADREAVDEFLADCEEDDVRAREVPATIPSHSARVEPLREELLGALASISPRSGETRFVSTVTGEALDTAELGAEYWYRNLRQPVRFEAVTRLLLEQGHSTLIEVSPHPVFALAVGETIEAAPAKPEGARVVGSLRRDEGGLGRFTLSLAEAHAAGAEIRWPALFEGSAAERVPLPTYPFQRQRFWLSSAPGAADARSVGLGDPDHPLLSTVLERADGAGLLFSGRLSLGAQQWLADHALAGTVLLPGTAFVELALRAAEQVGARRLAELTLQAPLVLTGEGAVQLQVVLGDPDEQGGRTVAIHSRPEDGGDETWEWTCHAQGTIEAESAEPPERLAEWPPPGSEPVDLDGVYGRLAEAGFEYGAVFQGLVAAWRAGDQLWAEVRLPEAGAEDAQRFGLHPALLDAAGHAALDAGLGMRSDSGEGAAIPFAWRGVTLWEPGATTLRLQLFAGEEGNGLLAFDGTGEPVTSIEAIVMRPVDPKLLEAATRRNLPLHAVEWVPVAAGSRGESTADGAAAELAVLDCRGGDDEGDVPMAAKARTAAALARIQAWLDEEPAESARLCVLTAGAVAAGAEEDPDLTAAPIWGLMRSAQSEHPGRIVLLDTDGSEPSEAALQEVLARGCEEPQLALREGVVLAPRLSRVPPAESEPASMDTERTVLVTGASGALGALVARHLVEAHGIRRLLLVSRRGAEAVGAMELQAELEALDAEVRFVACDVTERAQLEQLLAPLTARRQLGAVFHCAGVLDDGVLEALDAERLARVMDPKATAAWHLHELTAGAELTHFVLFSSVMGILGGAAQANYAAANSFLDALAAHRRAHGLRGLSLAWGGWAQLSGMIEAGQEAELARVVEQVRQRLGLTPMPPEQGLALLDAALGRPDALLVPAALDSAVLRSKAGLGTLPGILSSLVSVPAERQQGSLAERLAGVPEQEREGVVLELVRGHVAAVLGHATTAAVEPGKAFRDLGFDSLAAVELRNRLVAATGLQLAATIVFDYPSCAALAAHLVALVAGEVGSAGAIARRTFSGEPIAIVGMACRYPGGAGSPRQLWELVAQGRDAISSMPEDRGWDLDRLYDPDPDRLGSSYVREGGFLYDAPSFDPGFFGISPREALGMDPQERALLETCWEALEDAGLDPHDLRGSDTGVFAGVMYQDYGVADYGAGMTSSGVPGRVAYTFGFEGPTMTVDTACSSSLVAMHLAAQALHGGECDVALAGGVTVLSTPGIFAFFSRQRGLAPDGRCKPFSEAADGTAIAEGSGVVVLERLSDAERNGHPVLATVRGSAVNQDGASNGFSAPNGPSQERVIRQALANARLAPQDVDLVEAHGTGTTLGDPIEAGALLATYGQEREAPLKLGSLKSNIGHTQAAAGVGGVIKTVMAMREGLMPKTLHLDSPSTKVEWQRGQVELLSEPHPWEVNGRPRRAGVSSFGATGTNAHLILEEAPSHGQAEVVEAKSLSGPTPLVLSAKSPEALAEQANRLAAHLREHPELEPLDVAYSLATTRAAFEQRAVAIGKERHELLEGLDALAKGEPSPGTLTDKASSTAKLAYLFSGQGCQRLDMGKELYETHPTYAEAFDRACEALDAHLQAPLKDVILGKDPERLNDTTYAQPALFAVEVALYSLLESQGLKPELLCGHSIGELSAAHLAGVFSLQDAAKLIAARAKLMGELPKGGAMAAIAAPEAAVKEAIEGKEQELSIAAINGPASVVISGSEQAVEEIATDFEEQGKKTKRLAVSHAFHSPLIEPMLEQFAATANSIPYSEPQIPIVSNLSGELLTKEQATDPAYWVSHVRSPVRFAEGIATLVALGTTTYLEIGPDPVLIPMAKECLGDAEASFAPTLRSERPEAQSLALAQAAAHAGGAKLDWRAFFKDTAAKRVALPTYPFQRQRYWLSFAELGGDLSAAGLADAAHPLLAATIDSPASEARTLTGRLSLATHPWLADHAAFDTVLLPGTAMLELALRAGAEVGCEVLEELTLQAPLVLPERGGVQVQVAVGEAEQDGSRPVAVHSRVLSEETDDAADWTQNALGRLAAGEGIADARLGDLAAAPWPPPGAEPLEIDGLYERLAERGIEYGPNFRCVKRAWRRGEQAFVELSLPESEAEQAGRFGLHPALLDAAGHIAADLGVATEQGDPDQLALPFAWHDVRVVGSGSAALRAQLDLGAEGGGLVALDAAGAPVISVGAVTLQPVERAQLQALSRDRRSLYRVEWRTSTQPSGVASLERVALLGDSALAELAGAELHADLAELIAAVEAGAEAPERVIAAIPAERETSPLATCHAKLAEILALAQEWVAAPALAESQLVLLSEGAVASGPDEDPDLGTAPLWGLLRAAQSEHPGRFALLDSDGAEASTSALAAALANAGDEPQIALRKGELLVPRLVRAAADPDGGGVPAFDPQATVLISGGTSGLGAVLARHLAAEHGAAHLLLVSRSGEAAVGAAELKAELQELGAAVTIAACDVADRAQLETLLDSIPAEHPLGAIVHSAGLLDDGMLESLDRERLDRVLAPKVDAAWHLHELTAGLELSHFLLFSSFAGVLGAPGQANYAAANSFLDALAAHRQARGLPATSLAWGGWALESGMVGGEGAELTKAVQQVRARLGLVPMPPAQGLALFEAACELGEPLLVPVQLDGAELRARARIGTLPAILRGVVRLPSDQKVERGSLVELLAGVPEAERQRVTLDLIRGHIATVLGHQSAADVDPERPFQELGFDSLAAVELRNRLTAATGMRLAPTLVFDYPTAAALAGYLVGEVAPDSADAARELREAELREAIAGLERMLEPVRSDPEARGRVGARLRSLLSALGDEARAAEGSSEEGLEAMSHEEMFELIDQEFGGGES